MLRVVVSGGQSGVDQAAWRAARAVGLETGGWMPLGYRTEEGPRPEFADRYGARQGATDSHDDRTRANVRDSDGTIVLADDRPGPGTALTIQASIEANRPYRIVHPDQIGDGGRDAPEAVAAWIVDRRIETLNVAGDRESTRPGIGAVAEPYFREVFRRALNRRP